MSANAGTWFYQPPENIPFLVSERLNGTFWQARIVEFYWNCLQAESPFHAVGSHEDGATIELEWEPGSWCRLRVPEKGVDTDKLVSAISKRILAIPVNISYKDNDGKIVYEWHRDGGKDRWSQIQGNPAFADPQRL